MVEAGIIDPAKVTKAALENAVSIAGMVLTTNCLVTDKPDANDAAALAAAQAACRGHVLDPHHAVATTPRGRFRRPLVASA